MVCRHVLQAIPHADQAVAELVRVTKRGGWIHLIPEDYLMIHFEPQRLDADDFWTVVPRRFGEALGTDLRIGRRAYGILRRLGLSDITVDYVVVDPLRVPRDDLCRDFCGLARRIRRHRRLNTRNHPRAVHGAFRRHDRHDSGPGELRRLAGAGRGRPSDMRRTTFNAELAELAEPYDLGGFWVSALIVVIEATLF